VYVGYFEKRYGEQWIFTYDRRTRTAMLRGGDAQWAARHVVLDGEVEGLILGGPKNPPGSGMLGGCGNVRTERAG